MSARDSAGGNRLGAMVKLNSSLPKSEPRPRAWSTRARLALSRLLAGVGLPGALPVSPSQLRAAAPAWQVGLTRFSRSSFAVALLLLIACGAITLLWGVVGGQDPRQLWPELGGMTLDVFVILVVYEAFAQRRAQRASIERQLETIDDHKRWDAEEARLRIAGALRRLAVLGVTKVAFAGLRLSDFDFAEHGIRSLAGSTFYDGDWGNPHNVSGIRLQRVDFSHLDCSGVEFSPFEPLEMFDNGNEPLSRYANFLDCAFRETNLRGAAFNGAELRWTQAPPDDHFEWDEDANGEPFSIPISQGPFHNADLQGAGFRGCRLVNADFRGAENLERADFFGAKGLEKAIFDTPAMREAVMANAYPSDAPTKPALLS